MKFSFRLPRLPRPRVPRRALRTVGAAPSGPPSASGVLRGFRCAALWGIAVLITAAAEAAFAESYRGLLSWALRHGLAGFWAAAFPLQIDVFMAVGELVLFVATVDGWRWRDRAGAWAVALLGLAASVAGNVGHVAAADLQSRGTAAVPPLAAFAAMWLGLTVLKRVMSHRGTATVHEAAGVILSEIPADNEAAALIALRATTYAGNPLSGRQLEARFGLSRAQSTRVRQLVLSEANGQSGTNAESASAA